MKGKKQDSLSVQSWDGRRFLALLEAAEDIVKGFSTYKIIVV